MDIIYAAEKNSIASLSSLLPMTSRPSSKRFVSTTPNETGSFRINWQMDRFVLCPNGQIIVD